MREEFEMAVDKVKDFLESNKYARSTIAAHMRCYEQLGAHLADNGGSYGDHAAEAWLEIISPVSREGGGRVCRRALGKLDAAYNHRDIGSASGKSGMRQIYRCLEPWCKALLEDFVEKMSGAFGADYTQAAKISAARFLSRMTDLGICGPDGISHRIVTEYCRDAAGAKYTSKQAAGADRGHVHRFLQHLSANGMVRASIHMSLEQTVFPRLVFVDMLGADDRGAIFSESKAPIMSAERYYETALKVDPLVVQLGYADTAQNVFRTALKELFVFLDANALGYTAEVALLWANLMGGYTVQWRSFRRAIMIFEQFLESGRIDPGKVYRYQPDRAKLLSEWCRADFEEYIRLKKRTSPAESTLDMCRSSCLRLMEYLCSVGISSWGQLTPETLKEFHRQDSHSTPEGKNAYSSRIRHFLEYLGEIGRVAPAMSLAVPSESANRVSIVKTLSNADIDGIYRYRDSAESALGLRDAAMILMGLRMGLRASDVAKLRFGDVSWELKHISFQQEKTGSFLKLPMPVEVGNAIYRYITQGRPESGSEFVFINHKAPYVGLHPSVCRAALRRALPGNSSGFHVTRRTFASKMLANDVGTGRIAETLGHADNSSVMAYLSTDGDKMRLCALPLETVPVKGGMPI